VTFFGGPSAAMRQCHLNQTHLRFIDPTLTTTLFVNSQTYLGLLTH